MVDVRRALARREARGILHERTFLLAIAIQIFVAAFSSFLVVGLATVFDPSASTAAHPGTVALLGNDAIAPALRDQGFVVVEVANRATAYQGLASGRYQAVLEVTNVLATADVPVRALLLAPQGELTTPIVVVHARAALEAYQTSLRAARSDRLTVQPLEVQTTASAAPYVGFVYGVLVPLLLILPPFLSGALVADSITEEIQRGSLPVLLAAPVELVDVVEGKLLPNVALAPVLGAAWIGLLSLNGIAVGNPLGLLILVTAIAVLFAVAGSLIALVTRERNQAQMLYASLLLVLLLLGQLLPASPLNVAARLSAGSAGALAWTETLALAGIAALVLAGLHGVLRRHGARLAEGAERPVVEGA